MNSIKKDKQIAYDPELYELTHLGNQGDLQYYLKACKNAKNVLELGCGCGRITLELAKNGISVWGIDNHAGMLASLNKKAQNLPKEQKKLINTVCSQMQNFCLNQKFDRIIIPYNGILCLLSAKDLNACLNNVAKHLTDDGELILDFYYVFKDDEFEDMNKHKNPDNSKNNETYNEIDDEYVFTILDENRDIHVYEKEHINSDPQRFDVSYLYKIVYVDENIIEKEFFIEQRCIYRTEIEPMCKLAKLTLISATGDFLDEEINDDTDQIIVRAKLSSCPK